MRTYLLDCLIELVRLYPTIGFYGHKKKLILHIFKHVLPSMTTFTDLCSGTGLVAWSAKILGLCVHSNDIMGFPCIRLRALVENDTTVLTDHDIDQLESPNPSKQNFCELWYGPAIGTENARFIDLMASNLPSLSCEAQRNVAIYAIVICIMARMNYYSVSFSPVKTLTGKRKLAGFNIRKEFRLFALREFPSLVFSNGKQHRVTRRDALDLVAETITDLLYVDTPYCSPAGNYNSDLGFFDKVVAILRGHPEQVKNPYSRKAVLPPYTDFSKREDALLGFAKLFMRAKGCRRIIVSYNLTSKITPFEIVNLGERHYGKLVAWEELSSAPPKATRDRIVKSGEVLLVFDRFDQKPPSTLVGQPAPEVANNIRFIDLFCGGMGAFHLAGKQAGAECVFASEILKPATRNYTANHGLVPAGDITKIKANDVPDHDICCAGFPCMSWSISGGGLGFLDKRGELFFEITRIARAKRPLVLFLENVDNLASSKNRHALMAICKEIESTGYDAHYSVINSSYFGTATARCRLYFVCFRKDLGVTRFEFPKPTCELISLKDCLLPDAETTKYVISPAELETLHWSPQKAKPCPLGKTDGCPHGAESHCPLRTVRIGKINEGSVGARIYDVFHSPTIVSSYDSDIFLINGKVRRLAPREMANAMGFPKDFILPKNDALAKRYIGNSMAVPVVEQIFSKIIETLKAKANLAVQKAA